MNPSLAKGDKVQWTWGAHTASGTVTRKFTRRVKRTIKGATVIRKATDDEPAYLVVQEDGGRVLKSASELKSAEG